MVEDILKYVEGLKEVDFNPEAKNYFTSSLVKNWRVKGNNRIDAVFGKKSIFSRAKISTSAIVSDSLFMECWIKNELTLAPVVSFKRGSMYSSQGRVDTIDNSFVKDSEIEVVGICQNSRFENCKLKRGMYINCSFMDCEIEAGDVSVSLVDALTMEKSPTSKFRDLKRR